MKNNKNLIVKYLLKPLLRITFLIVVGIIFTIYFMPSQSFYFFLKMIFVMLTVISIMFIIPLLIIFLNHYFLSKNITIDIKNNAYIISNQLNSKVIDKREIDSIVHRVSFTSYRNTVDWVFTGIFSTYEFHLSGKRTLILSSFTIEKSELEIPKEKLKTRPIFYPLIKRISI